MDIEESGKQIGEKLFLLLNEEQKNALMQYILEQGVCHGMVFNSCHTSSASAMWKLGGSQELLDTYRKALDAHGMDEKILSPALRFTTSDVAASGANLYPMLLTDGPNGVISLGSPIKLAHDKGATILDFRKNLEQVLYRLVLQKSIVVEEERIYSIRQYEEETQTASDK